MRILELLAPARTAEIGIAAIDCGADAVYIAGPAFGARQAAGNSIEDIARLCAYAHRFGARIFATVNTLIYENELPEARKLVSDLEAAGVDALIVQDPAVLGFSGLPMHASTQCAIRTPEKARFLESLGYGRLVLERQLSLERIRAIGKAVEAEIEFFVHGALCVCYSGQCYLSEYLTGRSANRGACAQPCRSLYDLEDGNGRVLERSKPLLSLKDYNLLHRLEELADAGVSSFKIEGRLKGESYVKNVVRAYSEALDALVARYPERFCRRSFGKVRGTFVADLDKTFNRGYTELFLDGRRGSWAAEGGGEYVGKVERLTRDGFILDPSSPTLRLSNGDGFTFEGGGFRADVCEGFTVRCKKVEGLAPGVRLYRNLSAAFERAVESARCSREIAVSESVALSGGKMDVSAVSEDGRKVTCVVETPSDVARDPEAMLQSIRVQLAKRSGHYHFEEPVVVSDGPVPFMPAGFLNGIRRDLAASLDALPVRPVPLRKGVVDAAVSAPATLDYKTNIANSIDRKIYAGKGASALEDAYELTRRPGAELMRSKYCIRYELGLCPRQGKAKKAEPLFLKNGKERLRLDFHCAVCEMTVTDY